MASQITVLKQTSGVSGKTLKRSITVSGNYLQGAGNGEVVDLTGGTSLNPGAETVTGPSVPLTVPPQFTASIGGYIATLDLISGLSYRLRFWVSGGTELASAAYPVAISGGTITVATDFNSGDFDS